MSSDSHDTSIHVRKAAEGQLEDLHWVIQRYAPLLLAQARYRMSDNLRRRSGLEPEDLVAEVWAVTLPRLTDLWRPDPGISRTLVSFLSTTMRQRVRDLVAKYIRGKPGPEEDESEHPFAALSVEQTGVVTRVAQAEAEGLLMAAIAQLDDEDKALIVLRGIEENSPKVVGDLLDLKPNTVSVKYRRAVLRLQAVVGEGTCLDDFVPA